MRSISLLFMLAFVITTSSRYAGAQDNATPTTGTVIKTPPVPPPAAKTAAATSTRPKGVYWFAYTMEFPGWESKELTAKRDKHFDAGDKALRSVRPVPAGTKVEYHDERMNGRTKFKLYVKDNQKITREQFAKITLALMDEGGILIQRIYIGEDGSWTPLDEEPVLLADSVSAELGEKQEDEWKRVQKLFQTPPRLAAQTTQPTDVVASNQPPAQPANNIGNGITK